MKYLSGLVIVLIMSLASFQIASLDMVKHYQISSLVICILMGMVLGNLFQKRIPKSALPGIKFSQQKLLRLGIIFYGFFISFQQIVAVGLPGLVTDIIIIATTFVGGTFIGVKVLGLDREISMLTATGSSICGAAAILAAEPVVKAKPHQTAVAVATVVIFGTLAMFVYPAIYHVFNIDPKLMGIYTGATIHEVAQVVAAGNAMNSDIAVTSVIVKLTRVMMLAPFLILLSVYLTKKSTSVEGLNSKAKISIPWFAVFFVVAAGINSCNIIPPHLVHWITQSSVFLLTMAMGALGIDTNISKIRGVGIKPIILAVILFTWLIFGGYGISSAITNLFQ
ncbi:YeiH family protein [Marinomonas pollencensis]|uniref:Putative integral membrane protein (TIGR00698 family) n=1 Tax=Marinomonas pollencensis TaxID=491954 RepID=A0A3E0DRA2_9GAMM|nr:YeiH family protein [Marinomonas pollencensis]REG85667.1 putative integral membrane protein (TIGR00698 family) [Marinomonas pollencensis]